MKAHLKIVLILVGALLAACQGRNGLLPKSGGRPYEVLLTGDQDSIVYRMLTADVEALPQPEPSFDVSTLSTTTLNAITQNARNIVRVSIDSAQYSRVGLNIERNVYASPQLIIHVYAPSASTLKEKQSLLGLKVRNMLLRHEIQHTVAQLKVKRNTKAEKLLRSRLGITMWIPADMTASKWGQDFVWLSTTTTTGMQGLCVYTLPQNTTEKAITPEMFTHIRDSVMRENIKGETDSIYMQTVAESLVFRQFIRGLWDMKGDDMGGPFVCRIKTDNIRHRLVVAEAFVYAPETKKRNLIRQSEAILFTFKTKAED
uniref:DUF4837 family protein n=1 Tax=Prevotella sp. GTC17262 TaxID=3236797 RepID=A0AB33JIE7_9BACT